MAVFTVTTASDVVADDGFLSLREALALAQGSAGADTITFASGLQFIAIDQVLEIQAGEDVTINGDINGDGILDVAINGQSSTRLLNVAAGANLTLNHIGLVNGQDNAAAGAYGAPGAYGANGTAGSPGAYDGDSGTDGTNGGDGQDGTAGSDGADAVGGIFNAGNLTLRGVVFGYNSAAGGAGGGGGHGGTGGYGGNGGNGAYGGYGQFQPGGDGGHGGSGGNGGNGGNGANGGDAATSILNAAGGNVTIADTAFSGGYVGSNFFGYAGGAFGGFGGYGGAGGQGGFGGQGGYGGTGSYHGPLGYYGGYYYTPSYRGPGGNGGAGGGGGSGGAGGNSGDGGSAGGFILNRGTVTATGASAGSGGQAIAGGYNFGGAGGFYGQGGAGGSYGYGQPFGSYGANGSNGSYGGPGLDGAPGSSSTTILNLDGGTGSMSFADTVVYIHPTDVIVLEGNGGTTTVTFNVNRIGGLAEQLGVSWAVTGADAADFLGGVRPSGTATILSGSAGTQVTFQVVGDTLFELDETFTITLTSISDPVGGQVAAFGTTSVQGQIIDNDPGPVRLFTSATFATLVDDFAGLAAALAAATAGQAILIDETFAPPLGNVGAVTIGVNNLTIDADPPFDAAFTLGTGVTSLTLLGSATIDATGNGLNNVITGNTGDNVLNGLAGSDTLVGGQGNDQLFGGGDVDVLFGGSGTDLLNGGAGADAMTGGNGNDTYFVDDVGDTVNENVGGGTDTVNASISHTLAAEVENLILTGAANLNGSGNGLANFITGNTGDNVLNGFAGSDTLVGGQGNDQLFGGGDGDVLFGGSGTDLLNGGAGADAMTGGNGNDTYFVDDVGDTVNENVGGGTDTVNASISHTLAAEVENLILTGAANLNGSGNALANAITGNSGNNVLTGFAGSDTLIGGLGNDQLFGGGDGDFLFGGSGNDLLNGGTGADAMTGGNDDDTYVVDDAGDTVIELVGGGIDTINASISHTLAAEVENLVLTGAGNLNGTGNELANTITGNTGNNVLIGGAGADTLNGGAGFDQLFGGADDDLLFGGGGDDVLGGGNGNDTLTGGGGNDTLTGGLNSDNFVFSAALNAATNVDTITDYSVVDDTIHLDSAIFTGLGLGQLLASAFRFGAAALDADDRIIYQGATGALFYDVDGVGGIAQVQFASLTNGLAMSHNEFVVI